MAYLTCEMKNIFEEFINFGFAIYYLLENKKIELFDIKNILLKQDIDKAMFYYKKVLSKIDPNEIDNAFKTYSQNDPYLNLTIDKVKKILNIEFSKNIILKLLENAKTTKDRNIINSYMTILEKKGDVL